MKSLTFDHRSWIRRSPFYSESFISAGGLLGGGDPDCGEPPLLTAQPGCMGIIAHIDGRKGITGQVFHPAAYLVVEIYDKADIQGRGERSNQHRNCHSVGEGLEV